MHPTPPEAVVAFYERKVSLWRKMCTISSGSTNTGIAAFLGGRPTETGANNTTGTERKHRQAGQSPEGSGRSKDGAKTKSGPKGAPYPKSPELTRQSTYTI